MSVVLDTQPNGNYEPSESEVIEYGKWLGMELPQDNAFLWIAREGLKAPLPENWKACKSEKGELYYFNFRTGQSIWDHPMDEHFKELLKSEKLNPTPQSIAAGAKRRDAPASASSKKKNRAEGEGTVSSPTESKKKSSISENTAKIPHLKTLKERKGLPDELKIENGQGEGKLSNAENVGPDGNSLSLAPLSSLSSSLNNAVAPATKLSEPLLVSQNIKDEPLSGVGLNGVKALSKMNAPALSRTSSSHDIRAEGKEKITKDIEEELARYKEEKERNLERDKELLQMKLNESLRRFSDELERQKQAEMSQKQESHNAALAAERARFDAELAAAKSQIEEENAARREAELSRLNDAYTAQLSVDKQRIEEEISNQLEVFTRENRQASEIKREAQLQAFQTAGSLTGDLDQLAASFVEQYESSYRKFAETVFHSQQELLASRHQQQEALKKDFERETQRLKEENTAAVAAAKQKLDSELELLKQRHEDQMKSLKNELEDEQRRMKDIVSKTRSERENAELAEQKNGFSETIAKIRADQQKELESLKEELRARVEDELRATCEELGKELRTPAPNASPPADGDPLISSDVPRASEAPATRTSYEEPPVLSDPNGARNPSVHGDPMLGSTHSKSVAAQSDGVPPSLDDKLLEENATTREANQPLASAGVQRSDIKTILTEALREVFAESPFTLSSPAAALHPAPSATPRATPEAEITPVAAVSAPTGAPPPGGGAVARRAVVAGVAFPDSFQEQRELVAGEQKRVIDGRVFVESQRRNLEERRQQLKRTRHQWKQDVLAAKQEGVRSSSKRGQVLNNVRLALEEQSRGLEHDEAILQESEMWLLSKEQRLMQLKSQIEEQERLRGSGDASAVNCSVDTAALVTGYFKPQLLAAGEGGPSWSRRGSLFRHPTGGAKSLEGVTASPVLSKALTRIERRLDEVTSIMNMQSRRGSATSFSAANAGYHRSTSPSPMLQATSARRRGSQSHGSTVEPVVNRKDRHNEMRRKASP